MIYLLEKFFFDKKFFELRRQVFHISYSLFLIFFTYYFKKEIIILLLGVLITGLILLFFVNHGKKIPIISFLLDVFERKNTLLGKGAFYYTLGAFLAILFFPKKIAILSLFILGVCDSMATIYGTYLGRIKIYEDKTLEGTLVFFASSFLILIGKYSFSFSIICSAILSLCEMITFIDDNLVLPLIAGFLMSL